MIKDRSQVQSFSRQFTCPSCNSLRNNRWGTKNNARFFCYKCGFSTTDVSFKPKHTNLINTGGVANGN